MKDHNEMKNGDASGAEGKRKKSGFVTRTITFVALISALIVAILLGRWVFAAVAAICFGLAVYEELTVLQKGGYYPVWWISFAGLALSIPVMFFFRPMVLVPLTVVLAFCAMFCIMRRKEPKLIDLQMTLLPLVSIVLPGACIFGFTSIDSACLSKYCLIMALSTAIMDDTAAYLTGSAIGGPKLCPVISPKKTISGSIGGLIGSVLASLITTLCFRSSILAETTLPPLWTVLCCGLLAGVAGQMGDLLASMVKRCCGIKDFGNIFPGHGGMMDRLDSILLTSVIIYSYRVLFF